MPTLVAVAHGSRDPRALQTVTALLERIRELRPALTVRLGHIELNEPLLDDTLATLGVRGAPDAPRTPTAPATLTPPAAAAATAPDAVLVPVLLGRGHHVAHDLPRAAADAAATTGLRAAVAAPLGPHPLLVEALCDRLLETGWAPGDGAAVVLAAAGSRDPHSAADARSTARMLSERLGGIPVLPGYASAAAPTVPEAVRALAARGRHRIAVASYFTAPGRFAAQCAAAAPGPAAAPLGDHPALARLLLHRYDEALARPYASARREPVPA
ncbi:sirohydrochlorin chelatase [Streptomyces sp. NPDC002073]|uniref:sirohydrochlorin chelatase n=1 Tax=Streptomyces sp. NBC_00239 TaxID=2903640 RepID=UPI002E2E7BC2|nr:CbiX/SirB N-terminal domain-containing protein [Streptomyces sp. NBC_00239]